MTKSRLMLVAALAVVAVLAAWFVTKPGQTDIAGAAFAQDVSDVDTSGVMEMVQGAEDAPVTLIEYASFTCPHCANFHATVYPELKADYIETGKVRFIHREVYFDRYGLWAGIVARCGEGAAYFSIIDMIYAEQRNWTRAGDAAAIVDALRTIGKTAGLTDGQLDACLSDADHAEALYATFVKNAEEDGVNSTPTLFVNGTKHANMNYADLSKLLDDAAE